MYHHMRLRSNHTSSKPHILRQPTTPCLNPWNINRLNQPRAWSVDVRSAHDVRVAVKLAHVNRYPHSPVCWSYCASFQKPGRWGECAMHARWGGDGVEWYCMMLILPINEESKDILHTLSSLAFFYFCVADPRRLRLWEKVHICEQHKQAVVMSARVVNTRTSCRLHQSFMSWGAWKKNLGMKVNYFKSAAAHLTLATM